MVVVKSESFPHLRNEPFSGVGFRVSGRFSTVGNPPCRSKHGPSFWGLFQALVVFENKSVRWWHWGVVKFQGSAFGVSGSGVAVGTSGSRNAVSAGNQVRDESYGGMPPSHDDDQRPNITPSSVINVRLKHPVTHQRQRPLKAPHDRLPSRADRAT